MAAKTNGTSFPIWICSNGYALGIHAWSVFSYISFGIVLTGYQSRLASITEQLEQISSVKVTEYFLAHQQDILGIVDGSYLEEYPGLTDLFLSTVRQEYCQKQEKSAKSSVREKLQAMPKATSPKHSAKLKRQER